LSPRKRTFSELIRVTRSSPFAAEIFTSPGRLVQRRQRLRTDECRRDELVLGSDLDLAGGDPEQRLAVDDEAGHTADATRAFRPDRRAGSN
jgi:hypothetical protein